MSFRSLIAAAFVLTLGAQTASLPLVPQPPVPAPVGADPLEVPPDLAAFVRSVTLIESGHTHKVQAILNAFFRSPEEGGLGLEYDNTYSRTLQEVWRDRKANCLGLTMLLVAACKSIQVQAVYAEPLNTAQWRRSGDLIRMERHVVAMIRVPPVEDLVADFLPTLQRRSTRYIVVTLGEARIRALWAANRAAEMMESREYPRAEAFAQRAVEADPTCAVGWNTLGVLKAAQYDTDASEACYLQAMRIDPQDGTAVGNMELLLLRAGRWEESQAYRRLGFELRKKDPYFHLFLATEAVEAGKPEEAQKYLKTAIKLQPMDPDLYMLEAQISLQLGRNSEAIRSLELARRWANPKERERYDSKLAALKLANS